MGIRGTGCCIREDKEKSSTHAIKKAIVVFTSPLIVPRTKRSSGSRIRKKDPRNGINAVERTKNVIIGSCLIKEFVRIDKSKFFKVNNPVNVKLSVS
jgi:hypothetical protein